MQKRVAKQELGSYGSDFLGTEMREDLEDIKVAYSCGQR